MTITAEFGIIGNRKFLLISSTIDMSSYVLGGGVLDIPKAVRKAVEGNGI